MNFFLHNTLDGTKQPVFAGDDRTLRFYCCGPTVYGPAHIGNFRTFVVQDVFRRVAEAHGLATRHVRNLTDVDDKTIRQSQAEGVSLAAFCARWTERFHRDCAALNLLPPHHEPSAVANIPEQILLIERLLERGHAYRTEEGSVYFDVASFPAYGRLSGLDRREVRPTPATRAREQSDEYATREDAADFVLWKAQKPADGPNAWASPWGPGRPGWHIECSAMAMRCLGESFDLHSGGVDLIFPHHENEIAQSEAATGRPFVRHWFHVAHLLVDGGKMGKSLGNLYTLDDIVAHGFTPAELRLALLSGHYRQPLNFTWNSLHAARAALDRLARLLAPAPEGGAASRDFGPFAAAFAALSDDLNTPRALGELFSALEAFETGRAVFSADAAANLRALLGVWGLTPPPLKAAPVDVPPEIRALAEARQIARTLRDWTEADALRDRLTAAGWTLRESAAGYQLHPVSVEIA